MNGEHEWNARFGNDLLMDRNNTFVLNDDDIVQTLVEQASFQWKHYDHSRGLIK